MQKITQKDGYWVSWDGQSATVYFGRGCKKDSVCATFLKTIEPGTEAFNAIKSKNGNPSDYRINYKTIIRYNAEIAPLIDAAAALGRKEKQERDAKDLAAREARRATIAEKTPEWNQQLAALENQIPTGAMRVKITQTGYFDGYPTLEYSCEGTALSSCDVELLGCVEFLGDGEVGFTREDRWVGYISAEKFNAIRAENKLALVQAASEKENKKAVRSAKFDEARSTGKPVQLNSWMTNRCMNGHDSECSFDHATECAMPDGSTKIYYSCCY